LTTATAFNRRHPGATQYVLAFPLSWSCAFLTAGGPDGIPGTSNQTGGRTCSFAGGVKGAGEASEGDAEMGRARGAS
jgi:hypothetical protein